MEHSAVKRFVFRLLTLACVAFLTMPTSTLAMESAAINEQQSVQPAQLLDQGALDTLVSPVALYPDELLAIILPASTFPLQIVQAARYLEAHESDPTLNPNEQWDDTIVALLNYPETVQLLNDDLDWTWALGEAVINQQSDVVGAVEKFRERAHVAGNLESDERKSVTYNNGSIEISSSDPEKIYIPYYEPAEVVYSQPSSVYHYYPNSYPVYYYPYSSGHSTYSNPFWGVTTAFTIGWFTNRLNYHHGHYRSHPYYGRQYNRSLFSRYNSYGRSARHHKRNYSGDHWRRGYRHGQRPRHHAGNHRRANGGGHFAGRHDSNALQLNRSGQRAPNALQRIRSGRRAPSALQRNRSSGGLATIQNNRSNQVRQGASNRGRRNATKRDASLGAFANASNNRATFRNQQRANSSRTARANRRSANNSPARNRAQATSQQDLQSLALINPTSHRAAVEKNRTARKTTGNAAKKRASKTQRRTKNASSNDGGKRAANAQRQQRSAQQRNRRSSATATANNRAPVRRNALQNPPTAVTARTPRRNVASNNAASNRQQVRTQRAKTSRPTSARNANRQSREATTNRGTRRAITRSANGQSRGRPNRSANRGSNRGGNRQASAGQSNNRSFQQRR
jgi:hypothetical protein